MIIDGRLIAADIKKELKEKVSALGYNPTLAVISVGNDPATASFIKIKQKFGEEIGVNVDVYEYENDVTTQDLMDRIKILNYDESVHGIVVQLPLPKEVNAEEVLNSINPDADVDALGEHARVDPPVLAAVREILNHAQTEVAGKSAVVIGRGKLVGRPVAVWLAQEGANVEVVDDKTKDVAKALKSADIIVSGAGSPGLIKPEMLGQGVVLIDAGTSEIKGKLAGDADPACSEVAGFFTPVPGGVGPVTVAMLFRNLIELIG